MTRDRFARWRRGVTVILHPDTARIGAALRDRDLDVATVLDAAVRDQPPSDDEVH